MRRAIFTRSHSIWPRLNCVDFGILCSVYCLLGVWLGGLSGKAKVREMEKSLKFKWIYRCVSIASIHHRKTTSQCRPFAFRSQFTSHTIRHIPFRSSEKFISGAYTQYVRLFCLSLSLSASLFFFFALFLCRLQFPIRYIKRFRCALNGKIAFHSVCLFKCENIFVDDTPYKSQTKRIRFKTSDNGSAGTIFCSHII